MTVIIKNLQLIVHLAIDESSQSTSIAWEAKITIWELAKNFFVFSCCSLQDPINKKKQRSEWEIQKVASIIFVKFVVRAVLRVAN